MNRQKIYIEKKNVNLYIYCVVVLFKLKIYLWSLVLMRTG